MTFRLDELQDRNYEYLMSAYDTFYSELVSKIRKGDYSEEDYTDDNEDINSQGYLSRAVLTGFSIYDKLSVVISLEDGFGLYGRSPSVSLNKKLNQIIMFIPIYSLTDGSKLGRFGSTPKRLTKRNLLKIAYSKRHDIHHEFTHIVQYMEEEKDKLDDPNSTTFMMPDGYYYDSHIEVQAWISAEAIRPIKDAIDRYKHHPDNLKIMLDHLGYSEDPVKFMHNMVRKGIFLFRKEGRLREFYSMMVNQKAYFIDQLNKGHRYLRNLLLELNPPSAKPFMEPNDPV